MTDTLVLVYANSQGEYAYLDESGYVQFDKFDRQYANEQDAKDKLTGDGWWCIGVNSI